MFKIKNQKEVGKDRRVIAKSSRSIQFKAKLERVRLAELQIEDCISKTATTPRARGKRTKLFLKSYRGKVFECPRLVQAITTTYLNLSDLFLLTRSSKFGRTETNQFHNGIYYPDHILATEKR